MLRILVETLPTLVFCFGAHLRFPGVLAFLLLCSPSLLRSFFYRSPPFSYDDVDRLFGRVRVLIFVAWQSQVKRSVFSRSVKGIYHVVSTLGRRARACYGRRAPNLSPGFSKSLKCLAWLANLATTTWSSQVISKSSNSLAFGVRFANRHTTSSTRGLILGWWVLVSHSATIYSDPDPRYRHASLSVQNKRHLSVTGTLFSYGYKPISYCIPTLRKTGIINGSPPR